MRRGVRGGGGGGGWVGGGRGGGGVGEGGGGQSQVLKDFKYVVDAIYVNLRYMAIKKIVIK